MTLPKGWKKDTAPTEYYKKTPNREEQQSYDDSDATLWKDEVKDWWGRKVIDARYITTTEAVRNGKWISHGLMEDITVTNVSAKYKSQYREFDYPVIPDEIRLGSSESERIEVGDVVFMYQGQPYITFEKVRDPRGVANIARSALQAFLQRKEATSEKNIYCIQCNAKNPADSKFCSRCDASLSLGGCQKCGKVSPTGSVFCTQCGAPL